MKKPEVGLIFDVYNTVGKYKGRGAVYNYNHPEGNRWNNWDFCRDYPEDYKTVVDTATAFIDNYIDPEKLRPSGFQTKPLAQSGRSFYIDIIEVIRG